MGALLAWLGALRAWVVGRGVLALLPQVDVLGPDLSVKVLGPGSKRWMFQVDVPGPDQV